MQEPSIEPKALVLVRIAEPLLQAGVRASLQDRAGVEVLDDDPSLIPDRADVVIADSRTAGELAENRRRRDQCGDLRLPRILVIAVQAREHAVREGLNHGIRGFVLTSTPVDELVSGIRTLAQGGTFLCAPLASRLSQLSARDMLTSREDQVLQLLARGRCNKSIARDLDIAVGTVKVHVKSIMSKLDASCRTEAASIATERGLVDLLNLRPRRAGASIFSTPWIEPLRAEESFA